jgi:hypothetical protein
MIRDSNLKLQVALLVVALFLAYSGSAYSAEGQEYHFRQTRWGMTQEEVRKAENGEPNSKLSDGNHLVWTTELLEEQVLVVYNFAFNKLVRAKYVILKHNPTLRRILRPTVSPPSDTAFISDFEKFENALTERYGKPSKEYLGAPTEVHEDKRTDNEALRAQTNMIREAIQDGKTAWYAQWRVKEDTSIILIVGGKSGEMTFEIVYASIALRSLERKAPL